MNDLTVGRECYLLTAC